MSTASACSASILTGANEDGAAGLAAIDRAGGITVVQEPDSAQVPLMPEAALQSGPADFVLSLRADGGAAADAGAWNVTA